MQITGIYFFWFNFLVEFASAVGRARMCRIALRAFWNFPTPLVRPFNPTVLSTLTDIVVGFSPPSKGKAQLYLCGSSAMGGWVGAELGRYDAADAAPPEHERPYLRLCVGIVLRWWYSIVSFRGQARLANPRHDTTRPRSLGVIYRLPIWTHVLAHGRERSRGEILCTRIDCVCVRERADKRSTNTPSEGGCTCGVSSTGRETRPRHLPGTFSPKVGDEIAG